VLQALTETPDPGKDAYLKQFQLMKESRPSSYYTLVIVNTDTDRIIAVGSLFIEYKFIRNLGTAGHIEDIAVDTSVQGKGLGKNIINALTILSESLGAYKVILDCSESNSGESKQSLCSSPLTYCPPSQFSILCKVWI
jgi:glucosamine-phosphate N-acetyltransferase